MNMKKTTPLIFGILVVLMASLAGAVCNDCTLKISPATQSLCGTEEVEYELTVTNVFSEARSYSFSVVGEIPLVGVYPESIMVGPYQEETIILTLRPGSGAAPGAYRFTVTASAFGTEDSDDGIMMIEDCSVDVDTPESIVTCPAAGGFTGIVSNIGAQPDEYSLSLSGTCDASLPQGLAGVYLGPGDSVEVPIGMDIISPEGSCSMILTASGKYSTDSSETHVDVIPCYGLSAQLLPPENTFCPCEEKDYIFKVANTGLYPQDVSFDVTGLPMYAETDSVYLEGGEEASVKLTPAGTCCPEEDKHFTAVAQSLQARASADGLLKMRLIWDEISDPSEPGYAECSSISLRPLQEEKDIDCLGDEYTIVVENDGYTNQDITLTASGQGDFYIQPRSLTMQPGESRRVVVYAFPTGRPGQSIEIKAQGAYASDSLYLDIDFNSSVCTATAVQGPTPTGAVTIFDIPEKTASATGSATTPGFTIDMLSLIIAAFTFVLGLYVLVQVARSRRPEKRKLTMKELEEVRRFKDKLLR